MKTLLRGEDSEGRIAAPWGRGSHGVGGASAPSPRLGRGVVCARRRVHVPGRG